MSHNDIGIENHSQNETTIMETSLCEVLSSLRCTIIDIDNHSHYQNNLASFLHMQYMYQCLLILKIILILAFSQEATPKSGNSYLFLLSHH